MPKEAKKWKEEDIKGTWSFLWCEKCKKIVGHSCHYLDNEVQEVYRCSECGTKQYYEI